MDSVVRILMAIELPEDIDLIKKIIGKNIDKCEFLVAKTLKEFSSALDLFQPMVIVYEYHLAWLDGMASLKLSRERVPMIPFIFIFDSLKEIDGAPYDENESWDHITRKYIDHLGTFICHLLAQQNGQIIKQIPETTFLKRQGSFVNLINNFPGILFQCRNDRLWTMEFMSEGSFLLTRYYPEELENNAVVPFSDLVHPDDRDNAWLTVQEALYRGLPYCRSYRIFTRRNEERWVWEQGSGVWMNGAWHLEGLIWDITELKQIELKIQEYDNKFNMIMNHTDSLVAILNGDGVYEYASPSHKLLLGYSPKELLGEPGFSYIHPDELDRLTNILAKGISGEIDNIYDIHYRVLDKNGCTHYLLGNFDSIRDSKGDLEKIIYVGNDITKHLESEASLINIEKDKLRALVDRMPTGIILLQADGKTSYVNPKFSEITGYAQEDIPTEEDWLKKAFPSVEYRDQVNLLWQESIDKPIDNELSSNRFTITCKDKSEKTVQFDSVVLNTGELMTICQDVTARVALETQFMHAQKMECIGRLASGIAHDFNNLLTAIIGNADFVLMESELEDSLNEIIEEIKETAEKAADLTRQLLTFSRKQKGNPENLDLNKKVLESEKMLKRLIGEDVELNIKLASDLQAVKIDPSHLDQIIMNLVVNARDAMPQGGKLTIETANVFLGDIEQCTHAKLAPGDYVLLSISDTGTGIPLDIQSKIFDPFFTTKEKEEGTGLGLSTIYGIVKQSKGSILLDSKPGEGASMKILLPGFSDTVSHKKKLTYDMKKLYGDEAILLVDDEVRVRSYIKSLLYRFGYSVVEADDGPTAIKLFQANSPLIQFVLTDVVMPKMDGLELIKSLRENKPDLKALCMSGYTNKTIIDNIRKDKIPFIPKPFQSKELISRIRELLDAE